MEAIDLTNVLKDEHQGKWVVMSRKTRQIYVYADKPSPELVESARKQGCLDPLLHKVMPFDENFIS